MIEAEMHAVRENSDGGSQKIEASAPFNLIPCPYQSSKMPAESNSTSSNYQPTLDLSDYQYPPTFLSEREQLAIVVEKLKIAGSSMRLPVIWSAEPDNIVIKDLSELNNVLVVGPPAMGKSTFLHQVVMSLLFTKHPAEIKFVMIDCKRIEFAPYRTMEKHFLAKLPGEENSIIESVKQSIATLNALCIEMDNRYDLLKEAGCRNIKEYNSKFINKKLNPEKGHQYLPYIILVIDELVNISEQGRNEIIMPIQRLLSESYKTGIISLISTNQFIGENLPSALVSSIGKRVVFRMYDKEDYRRFLDTTRIDKLIEKGDFIYQEDDGQTKGRTIVIDYAVIERVCNFIGDQRGYPHAFLLPEYVDENDQDGRNFDSGDRDPLFEDAARLIVQSQVGSTSLIQRRMKLGYNRAGRMMDQLEAAGIVGPNLGIKVREVRFKTEMELEKFLQTL